MDDETVNVVLRTFGAVCAKQPIPAPDKQSTPPVGTICSIHLHPPVAGEPLLEVGEAYAETGKGLVGDNRVFNRKSRGGKPSLRQVSLIAREEISRHAAALGLSGISPGVVRSNIECSGIELASFIGRQMQVGEAVLLFYEARTPCWKMERIAPGLQEMMSLGRQGVLAQVVQSGLIRVGDKVAPVAISVV